MKTQESEESVGRGTNTCGFKAVLTICFAGGGKGLTGAEDNHNTYRISNHPETAFETLSEASFDGCSVHPIGSSREYTYMLHGLLRMWGHVDSREYSGA